MPPPRGPPAWVELELVIWKQDAGELVQHCLVWAGMLHLEHNKSVMVEGGMDQPLVGQVV